MRIASKTFKNCIKIRHETRNEVALMSEPSIFNRTFSALEKAVGIYQRRHTVIAGNIGNIETPNAKPGDIDFRSALTEALEEGREPGLVRTDPRHIDPPAGMSDRLEVVEEDGEWNGFNSMDIDREMGRLVENNLMYRSAVEMLLRKIATLKEVIREGGR